MLPEMFPPIVCRLIARHASSHARAQTPLTDKQIAQDSGLRVDQVRAISELYNWDMIPVDVMNRFAHGCGVRFQDKKNIEKQLRFIRRTKWLTGGHFLRRSEEWESRWRPMIINYQKFLNEKAQA